MNLFYMLFHNAMMLSAAVTILLICPGMWKLFAIAPCAVLQYVKGK